MFENWQNYLIQANLFLALFYALYWLLLRRETFFQSNRLYLLLSGLLAVLIPLVPSPDFVQETQVVQNLRDINPLPPTVSLPTAHNPSDKSTSNENWQLTDYLIIIYFIGVIILSLRFLLSLFSILRLAFRHQIKRKGRVFWVDLPNDNPSFSFLNILFWGSPSQLTEAEKQQILAHELVHIRQWHSLDILLSEVLIIFFWYNPLVWWYQKSLRKLHEYLADSSLIKKGIDKSEYAQLLVSQALMKENLNLGNSFYSPKHLKSRIMKMNQPLSANLARLKFVAIIPTLAFTFLVAACSKEKLPEISKKETQQNVQIPEGYRELKSYKIEPQKKNYIDFIFAKDTDYLFQVKDEENGSSASLSYALILREENPFKETKVLSGEVFADNRPNIFFKCDKVGVYRIEFKPINIHKPFIVNILFKKKLNSAPMPMDISKSEEINKQLQADEVEKILMKNEGTKILDLEEGKIYMFIHNGASVEAIQSVSFSLYTSEQKLLASNLVGEKKYPAMAYKCIKSGKYELKYSVNTPNQDYLMTVSAKPF